MLSANPIMSIALIAGILKHISSHRRKFENECIKLTNEILKLGKIFLSKIEDQNYYESLMMDIDF